MNNQGLLTAQYSLFTTVLFYCSQIIQYQTDTVTNQIWRPLLDTSYTETTCTPSHTSIRCRLCLVA